MIFNFYFERHNSAGLIVDQACIISIFLLSPSIHFHQIYVQKGHKMHWRNDHKLVLGFIETFVINHSNKVPKFKTKNYNWLNKRLCLNSTELRRVILILFKVFISSHQSFAIIGQGRRWRSSASLDLNRVLG